MTETRKKRPRDPNRLAKLIADIATGQVEDESPDNHKDPKAIARGQRGGRSRANKLTPEQRREIAKKAATARWKE